MKRKKNKSLKAYEANRRQILLEDNENEDKVIKRLEKRLGLNRRPKIKKAIHPLWMRQCGFDYLLDFEKEVENSSKIRETKPLGQTPTKRRKSKQVNLYGQQTGASCDEEKCTETTSTIQNPTETSNRYLDSVPDIVVTEGRPMTDSSNESLRKTIRSWINRISEAHMARVIAELTKLFSEHPRATIRSLLIDEVCTLLESVPINTGSKEGWLQLDLSVCVACIHACLHARLQHDNLVAYLVESLVDKISHRQQSPVSSNVLSSFGLFLSSLFQFGVLSSKLVFDLLGEFLEEGCLSAFKASHVICTAVGVRLRKADFSACQNLIQIATKHLTSSTGPEQVDLICELEGVIRRLSEKHSKEECVTRALHLKKMMRSWMKGVCVSEEMCLSVGLSDIRDRETRGRWWLVGSAGNPFTTITASMATQHTATQALHSIDGSGYYLPPEIEAAAENLGLRTASRRQLFSILMSTPGGPDATASALLKACSSSGSGGSSHEREMIQIVVHCLMAENPFNRFYPRVLGSFINAHRRFLMMIKCSFWDVLKKADLSVNAKANAGRALGILVLVYNLPLTVIKNFDFGDTSDGNVAFLRHVFVELCTGEYQHALAKLMQLSTYTHLSRNTRIFIRKHFSSEADEKLKSFVLRLAEDMRESEIH
ncbi:Nucleolar MIF4G domain-containing protein 1 [Clonorchis sinensis]|uniref:Nucleolar MIF4G domain-containing protein 1 n=1 Tax=Clonorchis sinensis TaxID=79923 RepID=A0A8T1MQZ8_CLOSI|nr:Nucleolar MIF4G domain-containing protein 1 [Clonorchis sinensis]